MCYGGIIEQHRFHPEAKFCGSDGQSCARNTRGLLERRLVQIGRKIPIRKENNRSWQAGNDPSILQGCEPEQSDSTATEYIRTEDSRKHTTHAAASQQLREWLRHIPLDLVSYHKGIDRHTLRSVRDGNPARREVLVALTELKKLWMNAEQCGVLKSAQDAVRRSRRDYADGEGLRDLMRWPIPMPFWAAMRWSTTGILPGERPSTGRAWNSIPTMPPRTSGTPRILARLVAEGRKRLLKRIALLLWLNLQPHKN